MPLASSNAQARRARAFIHSGCNLQSGQGTIRWVRPGVKTGHDMAIGIQPNGQLDLIAVVCGVVRQGENGRKLKAAYIKAAKAGKSVPHKAGFRLAFRSIAQMAQATAAAGECTRHNPAQRGRGRGLKSRQCGRKHSFSMPLQCGSGSHPPVAAPGTKTACPSTWATPLPSLERFSIVVSKI